MYRCWSGVSQGGANSTSIVNIRPSENCSSNCSCVRAENAIEPFLRLIALWTTHLQMWPTGVTVGYLFVDYNARWAGRTRVFPMKVIKADSDCLEVMQPLILLSRQWYTKNGSSMLNFVDCTWTYKCLSWCCGCGDKGTSPWWGLRCTDLVGAWAGSLQEQGEFAAHWLDSRLQFLLLMFMSAGEIKV